MPGLPRLSPGFRLRAAACLAFALAPLSRAPAAPAPLPAPAAREAAPAGWLGLAYDAAGGKGQGNIVVTQVFAGAPAEAAGLAPGDTLLQLDGKPLARKEDVASALRGKRAGERVEIRFARGGAVRAVGAALAAKPGDMSALAKALIGRPAPPLAGVALAGPAPDLARWRGKVVVVDFWATWCGPCRASMPVLDSLYRSLRGRGLEIVGVSAEEPAVLEAFRRQWPVGYPLMRDSAGATTRRYQAFAFPTAVLIDKGRVVRGVEVGYRPAAEAEAWIRPWL